MFVLRKAKKQQKRKHKLLPLQRLARLTHGSPPSKGSACYWRNVGSPEVNKRSICRDTISIFCHKAAPLSSGNDHAIGQRESAVVTAERARVSVRVLCECVTRSGWGQGGCTFNLLSLFPGHSKDFDTSLLYLLFTSGPSPLSVCVRLRFVLNCPSKGIPRLKTPPNFICTYNINAVA